MLLSFPQSAFEWVWLLLRIPVVMFALSFHEMSHAFASHKLGDDTAKNLGRLTMNPLKHLDIIGTVSLVLFGFGWAKPVPINTRNFKNPKKGMVLSALAGPFSNLLLSILGLALFITACAMCGFLDLGNAAYASENNMFGYIVCLFLYIFHYTNIAYAIFNMLPVIPLDGSRLALAFLPERLYFGIMKYERIIMYVFLILMFIFGFSLLGDLIQLISNGMLKLVSFIPGLGNAEYMSNMIWYNAAKFN